MKLHNEKKALLLGWAFGWMMATGFYNFHHENLNEAGFPMLLSVLALVSFVAGALVFVAVLVKRKSVY